MKLKGICTVAKWEEKITRDLNGEMKISKADVEYKITGQINGNAVVNYIMFYSHYDKLNVHNSSAEYVGIITFSGIIADKTGSFVLQDKGKFNGGMVNSEVSILKNSGTMELQGISGNGVYKVDQSGFAMDIDCDL
jgi:hypothetical protein